MPETNENRSKARSDSEELGKIKEMRASEQRTESEGKTERNPLW